MRRVLLSLAESLSILTICGVLFWIYLQITGGSHLGISKHGINSGKEQEIRSVGTDVVDSNDKSSGTSGESSRREGITDTQRQTGSERGVAQSANDGAATVQATNSGRGVPNKLRNTSPVQSNPRSRMPNSAATPRISGRQVMSSPPADLQAQPSSATNRGSDKQTAQTSRPAFRLIIKNRSGAYLSLALNIDETTMEEEMVPRAQKSYQFEGTPSRVAYRAITLRGERLQWEGVRNPPSGAKEDEISLGLSSDYFVLRLRNGGRDVINKVEVTSGPTGNPKSVSVQVRPNDVLYNLGVYQMKVPVRVKIYYSEGDVETYSVTPLYDSAEGLYYIDLVIR